MTEHGAILIDGIQKGTTHRCPHCCRHFLVVKGDLDQAKQELGSGHLRDLARPKIMCLKCGRLTCGRKECSPHVFGCIPHEARMEFEEGTGQAKYNELIQELQAQGGRLL